MKNKSNRKKKHHKKQIQDVKADISFSATQSNSSREYAFSFKYLVNNKDYGLDSLSNENKIDLVKSFNIYS